MKIIVSFRGIIQQCGTNQIEIMAREMDGPFFAQDAIEMIAGELSAVEQDRLADDVIAFAQGEALKRSLIVEIKQ